MGGSKGQKNRETGAVAPGLTPRPQEWLAQIGIGVRFQDFGPLAKHARFSRVPRPGLAIPADLFHGMVELNAVTVRIEDLDSIINAGMKLGGNNFGDFDVMVVEKFHRIAELAVVSNLQAERGTFRMGAETKHVP